MSWTASAVFALWPELQNRDCEQLPREPSFDKADGGGHRTQWQTLSLPLLKDHSVFHCSLLMPESWIEYESHGLHLIQIHCTTCRLSKQGTEDYVSVASWKNQKCLTWIGFSFDRSLKKSDRICSLPWKQYTLGKVWHRIWPAFCTLKAPSKKKKSVFLPPGSNSYTFSWKISAM